MNYYGARELMSLGYSVWRLSWNALYYIKMEEGVVVDQDGEEWEGDDTLKDFEGLDWVKYEGEPLRSPDTFDESEHMYDELASHTDNWCENCERHVSRTVTWLDYSVCPACKKSLVKN